jgi:DNA-binding MarR family transcriptional regulator
MLKDEIKKTRPFDSQEEEAYLNLLRTTTVLAADFERLFKDAGLSEPQYNVLRILRGAGVGGVGLPCLEIASRMITRVPDITRLVDRLETAGLVERARTSEDRRVVLVKITRKGLDAIAPLDKPIAHLHRQQMGHMARRELQELSRLLVKARRADGEAALACDAHAPNHRDVAENDEPSTRSTA